MDGMVGHGRRIWLYLVVGLILLFLVLPVLIVVPMSFTSSRFLDFPPPGLSLRWYQRFLTADWFPAMMLSLRLAVATVVIATPLGVAAAYAIHHAEHRAFKRLETVLLLPLMVPHLIIGVGIFYGFVRFNLLGSFVGMVMAHVMLALPFVVISTLSGLRGFDGTQELVARIFGCSRLRAFLSVTLPQIRGAVLTGALFAFVSSLDEVVVALLVSGGRTVTVTKVMFDSLRDEIDPTIAAVSTLLIFASVLGLALTMIVQRFSARRVSA